MRQEEAQWIGDGLARHVLPGPGCSSDTVVSIALNLGSGTRQAREVSKPYVHALTIEPLLRAGFRVVHSDLLEGDGIDMSGDLFDPAFQQRLAELQPRVILFCNVLEHLPLQLRTKVPAVLARLLAPGGYLFITVPRSYPYHADPIDTMYRPTPDQVAVLFPTLQVVDARVLDSDSYLSEFRQGSMGRRTAKLLRLLAPFVRPKRWLSHAHRFLWLYRPYRHSCLLLRKPG